ncbi:hypothetical protein FCL40_08265 [Ferrimonas sediminicola]|uniref:Uncharacterized protein n=1 Tax=Ferrimonas sediminicola TaxID=2569538 RepID=A0A4U1BFX2_9GAMM|nr:hypothetical protein [Ferrimonas sediminicola]TKB49320.1 hypothetical protein FCL40_08265 [Ferrimonas sediminicola]
MKLAVPLMAALAPLTLFAQELDLFIEITLPGAKPMQLETRVPANQWSEHPLGDYRLSLQPTALDDQVTVDAVLTSGSGERLNQLLMPAVVVRVGEQGTMALGEPPRVLSFSVGADLAD